MECGICHTVIQDDCRFCTKCGAPVMPPNGVAGSGDAWDSPVRRMLSDANLARLRRDWNMAERLATVALQMDPKNAAAHSLLGDISADRGDWEKALRWYDLALDLNPENESDQKKRQMALDLLGRVDPCEESEAEWATAPVGLFCISWLRVGTIIGAVTVVIVTIMASIMFTWLGGKPVSDPVPAPAVSAPRPKHATGAREGRGALNDPMVTYRPPSVASNMMTSTGSLSQTSDEHALGDLVTKVIAGSPWSRARVIGAQLDPRTHWGSVTVYFPAPPEANLDSDSVVRLAYLAGISGLKSRGIQGVTIRIMSEVRQDGSEARKELLLVADLSGQIRNLDPVNSSRNELGMAFEAPWWNPALVSR